MTISGADGRILSIPGHQLSGEISGPTGEQYGSAVAECAAVATCRKAEAGGFTATCPTVSAPTRSFAMNSACEIDILQGIVSPFAQPASIVTIQTRPREPSTLHAAVSVL